MRIVYLGTGEIGLPSLEALLRSPEHEVIAVVTQPDKPVGRKLTLTPPKVKVLAQERGIPVLQPVRLRKEMDELAGYTADLFVVAAYGQILPRQVLEMPRLGCVNVHTSLLPLYRGAAPIQNAIREGDAETGITMMWMDEGLDTGDILLQHPVTILPDDTGGSLHDRLAQEAPVALTKALELISGGKAPRMPQDSSKATHCGKLDRASGHIRWDESSESIARMVRAYSPWPGTYSVYQNAEGAPANLKIHQAVALPEVESCPTPGTVLSAEGRLLVSCGQGTLEILELQQEGRKRMPAADFLRGAPLSERTLLT